eukprot:TRINITY_DN653_c0_g1_i1.p1 TRINITY_DN653_c0_g1~~TRINITY_DN653_c0_g1_i1.p1  ORF type:complete len:216 (-),score=33.69 TRINITY_DN653_c0_g1_i1:434-1081(-)
MSGPPPSYPPFYKDLGKITSDSLQKSYQSGYSVEYNPTPIDVFTSPTNKLLKFSSSANIVKKEEEIEEGPTSKTAQFVTASFAPKAEFYLSKTASILVSATLSTFLSSAKVESVNVFVKGLTISLFGFLPSFGTEGKTFGAEILYQSIYGSYSLYTDIQQNIPKVNANAVWAVNRYFNIGVSSSCLIGSQYTVGMDNIMTSFHFKKSYYDLVTTL